MTSSGVRRWAVRIALAAVAALLLVQLVPYGRDHADPPAEGTLGFDSASTRSVFDAACADCHSNHTSWRWYSNVAPASWLVQHDVDDGRAAFDVSRWNRAQPPIDEILEQVRSGEMPPWQYRLAHGEARLSAAQKAQLAAGMARSYAADPPAAVRGG